MGRLPLPIQLSICIIVFYRSEKFIKLCLKQFLQRVGFLICFFINIPWFSFLLFHFSVTHNLSHSFSKLSHTFPLQSRYGLSTIYNLSFFCQCSKVSVCNAYHIRHPLQTRCPILIIFSNFY